MAALAFHRKSLLDWPPKPAKAKVDAIGWYASALLPFAHGKRFAVECKTLGVAAVSVLGLYCRPSAVLFGISSIIVDAVKAKPLPKTRRHVSDKNSGVAPLLTYSYPPSAIKGKCLSLWVVASLHHAVPRFIQSMATKAVLNASGLCQPATEAAAGFSLTPDKSAADRNFFRPAITEASPLLTFRAVVFNLLNRGEEAKFAARFNLKRHADIHNGVSSNVKNNGVFSTMRYRVKSDGATWLLTVEDGEGVILATVPAGTLMEAKRLQRIAVIDGLDALARQAPPKKKGK